MPRTSDFTTASKARLAIVVVDKVVNLCIDREDAFTTVRLTHQEARRLAHSLMGSSDPYQDASEA